MRNPTKLSKGALGRAIAVRFLIGVSAFITLGIGVPSPQPATGSADPLHPLDTSINVLLRAESLGTALTTAVVPIVGMYGSDATLRFVQITGSQAAVSRVRAVLEIDNDGSRGPYQFTSLVPVSSVIDHGRGHRVDGVGITAIIAK